MSIQVLRKQLVGEDGKVSRMEEMKQMNEKAEIQVHNPGPLDHWGEQNMYVEKAGAAVSTLGELIEAAQDDKLSEFTMHGVAHILQMLGRDMINNSLDCYKHLERFSKIAES